MMERVCVSMGSSQVRFPSLPFSSLTASIALGALNYTARLSVTKDNLQSDGDLLRIWDVQPQIHLLPILQAVPIAKFVSLESVEK